MAETIVKELKKLGLTINGKEPNGETVSEVVNSIADDYEEPTFTQKQADWNEADSESVSFIKNKPIIPTEKHLYRYEVVFADANDEEYDCRFSIYTSENLNFTNPTLNDVISLIWQYGTTFKNNKEVNCIMTADEYYGYCLRVELYNNVYSLIVKVINSSRYNDTYNINSISNLSINKVQIF